MNRLHRNQGGYRGEALDAATVLPQLEQAARERGWRSRHLPVEHEPPLLVLERDPAPVARTVYVSAGIHGDEPAGPLALLELIQEDAWPAQTALRVAPCLNPSAFEHNSRLHPSGVDLNRDYRDRHTERVRVHTRWLDDCPAFCHALLLHEDWEANGFYLYELTTAPVRSLAQRIIEAVSRVCPIDQATRIDGRPARGGIIRPPANLAERPDWPEAFYLVAHKTTVCYTFEAPSDFPLPTRVAALKRAVRAALAEPASA